MFGLVLITIYASEVLDRSPWVTTNTESDISHSPQEEPLDFPHCCQEGKSSSPQASSTSSVRVEPKPAKEETTSDSDEEQDEPSRDQADKEEVLGADLEKFAQRISGFLAKDDLPIKKLFLLKNMVEEQILTINRFFAEHSASVPKLHNVMYPHQRQLKKFLTQIQGRIKATKEKLREEIKQASDMFQDTIKDEDCCSCSCSFFSCF